MSEKKQFLIGLTVIIIFSSVLLVILSFYKNKNNEKLIKTGVHTIAFYSYNASRPGTTIYHFKFNRGNQEYIVSSGRRYKKSKQVPFKEIPVIVSYERDNPSNNILLPDEEFEYKGYRIKWAFDNDEKYYEMDIEEISI